MCSVISVSRRFDIQVPILPRWTKLTFAGWTLGFVLILVGIAATGLIGLGDLQFPVGLGMGLGVGWCQARVIESVNGRGRPWFVASGLGMAVPFFVYDVATLLRLEMPLVLPLNVVLGGLVVGGWQAWLLRRHARAPWSWIAVSVIGWALAGSTVAFNERFLPRIPGLTGALLYVAVILTGGIALGVVGGLALDRILVSRRPEPAHV